jgi:hypothetical protein
MVGGNWLNKAGVLLLVIGIALLLGYEFSRVGPLGRVSIGLGVSFVLLTAGILVERKPVYSIFARGLIGGGWAALYFTTYAMHAVQAAKVLDNPYLATLLLLVVALGMILHSLRYRSQTVSGLAYFIAFATLALGESTPFSVLALIPLAGSLLVLAYRFEWTRMAVFGIVATYATCASRTDTGAPLASTQALFGAYWLLFEGFDLMRVRRRVRAFSVESLILPLNALGFLGLSLVKWTRSAHEHLYLAFAAGGLLYLLSALARARLSPPDESKNDGAIERIASGGYEGPITISAVLTAISIFQKASGMWINVGLLIEAEVLFLAGVRFQQIYLRRLAGGVFATSLIKLMTDVSTGDTTRILRRTWMKWTPVAVLTAAMFYLNRALKVAEGKIYSVAAAALIVLVLAFETPPQYVCVSLLVYAAFLFEFGFRTGLDEFRLQSYGIGVLGTGSGLLLNIAAGDPAWRRQWLPIAIAAAVHYAAALRVRFGGAGRLKQNEAMVSWFTSASATGLLMAIAWKLAPGDYLGVIWLALGAMLFELGLRRLPSQLRQLAYVVSATACVNLFYSHVFLAHKGSPAAQPISLGIAALLCYGLSGRLFKPMPDRIPDEERAWTRDLNAAAGTLFVMTVGWLELPAPMVALAWAVVGLVLLELGFSFTLSRFRLLGNLVAATVSGRLFMANFTTLGNTLGISHRLLTVVPILISQYYVWTRYRRHEVQEWERSLVRFYLYAPAILAVALVRFELGRSMAVVGWALLMLALYRTGLTKDIADLRWQSYAIAILAFWRCWNTNFYIPESLAGVRGRVLTGTLAIASFYCANPFAAGIGGRLLKQVPYRSARTHVFFVVGVRPARGAAVLRGFRRHPDHGMGSGGSRLTGRRLPIARSSATSFGSVPVPGLRAETVPLRSAATRNRQPDSFLHRAGGDPGQRVLDLHAVPRPATALPVRDYAANMFLWVTDPDAGLRRRCVRRRLGLERQFRFGARDLVGRAPRCRRGRTACDARHALQRDATRSRDRGADQDLGCRGCEIVPVRYGGGRKASALCEPQGNSLSIPRHSIDAAQRLRRARWPNLRDDRSA